MSVVLVATHAGCRVFTPTGERETELAGRQVSALTQERGRACLGVVDECEVWRRNLQGAWARVAQTDISIQSLISILTRDGNTIYGGGMDDAVMLRVPADGKPERLTGFDNVSGRDEWFAGGPPLGVRSLCAVDGAATADGTAILAAVHVGGIPRSTDEGETWTPTVPILFDVHEVRAHPSLPGFVAAAAAVGLCVSHDSGLNWSVISEGLSETNSLAVAVLEDEVLFSIQDGPFAKQSQVWRWRIGDKRVEVVRDGLPEWLDGKVDTGWIVAGSGRTAIIDQGTGAGGSLWLSQAGSRGWERIATGLPYALGLLVL